MSQTSSFPGGRTSQPIWQRPCWMGYAFLALIGNSSFYGAHCCTLYIMYTVLYTVQYVHYVVYCTLWYCFIYLVTFTILCIPCLQEMIIDKVQGKPVPRYLIYDIIKFEVWHHIDTTHTSQRSKLKVSAHKVGNIWLCCECTGCCFIFMKLLVNVVHQYSWITLQGQDVGKTDFDRRLLCINKEIITARHEKIKIGQLNKDREPFSVRAKPFWDLATTRSVSVGCPAQGILVLHCKMFPLENRQTPISLPLIVKYRSIADKTSRKKSFLTCTGANDSLHHKSKFY